jgi:hypothetical protein
MEEMMQLKRAVKAAGGTPTPYQVDLMRYQQWRHVNDILDHPLRESYQARIVPGFRWADWIDPAKAVAKPHARSDVYLKNYPNRSRPIEGPAPASR